MKYAVIAALLATNTQALTGCKKGLGAKIYSDSKCKEDANAEHTLLDDDVAKTGKCVSHKATKEDMKPLLSPKPLSPIRKRLMSMPPRNTKDALTWMFLKLEK